MAYALWLWQFRLLRFAIPLEVMSGTLIMVAIESIDRIGRSAGASPRRAVAAGGAVLVLLAAWTIPMSWGRVPFGRRVFAAASAHLPLPPDSLVLVAEQPTAYVLPLLDAPGLEAVGVSYLSALSPHVEAEVAARVRSHAGPTFAVRRTAATPFRVPGASLSLADCVPLTTGLETLQLCRVIAVPSRE